MTSKKLSLATLQASFDKKIALHIAAKGVSPDDVTKSKNKVSQSFVDYINQCEKSDFAQWVETAPTKSIMRAVNFLDGLVSRDASLGGDLITQALIQTATIIDSDTLALELVKHQTIVARETDELNSMTNGRSVRKAQHRQAKSTALSMISNRCGKNGFLQFLGMVTRSTDKAVVVDRNNQFYKAAYSLLYPVAKVEG